MITTANAQRKKAGKARLGFLNPLMYTRPSILNEITHGWNNCTAIRTTCCPMGFTSASGKNSKLKKNLKKLKNIVKMSLYTRL